jgi:hypothetical protein
LLGISDAAPRGEIDAGLALVGDPRRAHAITARFRRKRPSPSTLSKSRRPAHNLEEVRNNFTGQRRCAAQRSLLGNMNAD